jgi:hypothetical protein
MLSATTIAYGLDRRNLTTASFSTSHVHRRRAFYRISTADVDSGSITGRADQQGSRSLPLPAPAPPLPPSPAPMSRRLSRWGPGTWPSCGTINYASLTNGDHAQRRRGRLRRPPRHPERRSAITLGAAMPSINLWRSDKLTLLASQRPLPPARRFRQRRGRWFSTGNGRHRHRGGSGNGASPGRLRALTPSAGFKTAALSKPTRSPTRNAGGGNPGQPSALAFPQRRPGGRSLPNVSVLAT